MPVREFYGVLISAARTLVNHLIIYFLFIFSVYSQDIKLEPITVEKNVSFRQAFSRESFSSYDMERIPHFSPEAIVDYTGSVDLRQRSLFGIQQDISFRGDNFEGATVKVAGIDVSDPQTAHFSMELPLTDVDVGEVEVDKGAQSVSFSLRQPQKKETLLRSFWGQHGLWDNLVSASFPISGSKNRVSFQHRVSSGARKDTDFETYTFSLLSLWKGDPDEVMLFAGANRRDFGADSFYSASYTSEEEHTRQQFVFARWRSELWSKGTDLSLYFRRHRDKFILIRQTPSFFTNYNTSYTYGLISRVELNNKIHLDVDVREEELNSTDMGKHERLKRSFSFGTGKITAGRFVFSGKGGLFYAKRWKNKDNLSFALAYSLKEGCNLYFSFDSFWRLPSFTELYYDSPANRGNPSLSAQRTRNFEWGLQYKKIRSLMWHGAFFLRDERNAIDWVRNNPSGVWTAENIGALSAYGVDAGIRWNFISDVLKDISLEYTYVNSEKKRSYSFSKYIFHYARHKLIVRPSVDIGDLRVYPVLRFLKPVNEGPYTIVDIKLVKKISNLTFYIEGMNIFNKNYEEMEGIHCMGRWYRIGIGIKF